MTLGPPQFGGAPVAMVACGGRLTLVVTRAGRLFAFGEGDHGQLGHSDRNSADLGLGISWHNDEQDELVPRQLAGQFGGACALSLTAGAAHTMVITTCGEVWGCRWGGTGSWGWGTRPTGMRRCRGGARRRSGSPRCAWWRAAVLTPWR